MNNEITQSSAGIKSNISFLYGTIVNDHRLGLSDTGMTIGYQHGNKLDKVGYSVSLLSMQIKLSIISQTQIENNIKKYSRTSIVLDGWLIPAVAFFIKTGQWTSNFISQQVPVPIG